MHAFVVDAFSTGLFLVCIGLTCDNLALCLPTAASSLLSLSLPLGLLSLFRLGAIFLHHATFLVLSTLFLGVENRVGHEGRARDVEDTSGDSKYDAVHQGPTAARVKQVLSTYGSKRQIVLAKELARVILHRSQDKSTKMVNGTLRRIVNVT